MKSNYRILVVSALAAAAVTMPTMSGAASKPGTAIVRSDEISGQRHYYDRRYEAPAYGYPRVRYRGSADPSFGPDGRLYRVPEYLRGQCYVDLGYGRFASCSNR